MTLVGGTDEDGLPRPQAPLRNWFAVLGDQPGRAWSRCAFEVPIGPISLSSSSSLMTATSPLAVISRIKPLKGWIDSAHRIVGPERDLVDLRLASGGDRRNPRR